MAEPELPAEAPEADVLEQHTEVRADADDPGTGGEPDWEADPADVAEQGMPVDDDEDGYPEG